MYKKNIISIFFITLFFNFPLLSITINNETDEDLFVSTYYSKKGEATKAGESLKIKRKSKASINRPKYKFRNDRILALNKDKDKLEENLDKSKHASIPHCKIGVKYGNSFYIYKKNDILKCCSWTEWKVIKPTLKAIKSPFEKVLHKAQETINKHPYIKTKAEVRRSSSLNKKEVEFLKKRHSIVKNGQEKFLEKKLDDNEVLNVAFCCSGGGYRAMISTLGWILGSEKIGLTDCATYFAGLSGSTWFMSQWTELGIKLKKLKKIMMEKVGTDLKTTTINPIHVTNLLAKKYLSRQPITSVDIYGAILANKLFSDYRANERQKLHLSTQKKIIKDGNWLFPIYTAVEGGYPKHNWFEFTPYEIGSSYLNAYVPTWSMGRKFRKGKSKDFSPEQSLGYFMGIWGSAFTVELKEITGSLEKKLPKKIYNFFEKEAGEKRVSPAKLFNPVYGIEDLELNRKKKITLVDAGLDFNLPFPPLFRTERKVDVIVVCDASASAHKGAPAVQKAEKWAKENGIKFPPIDYNIIGKEIISVHKDENDPSVPTIIYMSLVANKKFNKKFKPVKEIEGGFCSTFNFKYTNHQFGLLSGLTKFNTVESKEIIKKAMLDKINQKKTY